MATYVPTVDYAQWVKNRTDQLNRDSLYEEVASYATDSIEVTSLKDGIFDSLVRQPTTPLDPWEDWDSLCKKVHSEIVAQDAIIDWDENTAGYLDEEETQENRMMSAGAFEPELNDVIEEVLGAVSEDNIKYPEPNELAKANCELIDQCRKLLQGPFDQETKWLLETLKKHGNYSTNEEVIKEGLKALYQKMQEDQSKNW